jgi:hypothetical protein
LRPVRFWAFDGAVIDPPVCVPIPEVAIRPATDVAVPVDEPPGFVPGFVGVQALIVVVMPFGVVARVVANGPIWVFPRTTPPAALSLTTVVASNGGTKPWKMNELAVVSTPAV